MSKYFEKEYQAFEEVYNNQHKYNLSWAFEDAQEHINDTFNQIKNEELPITCSLLKAAIAKSEAVGILQKDVFKYEKRAKWLSRIFSNTHLLLTVFEILLSVLLVLVMTNISHFSEGLIESESLSVMAVLVFAFLKVFVERMALQPFVENIGWNLYKRSYTNMYNILDQSLDMNADEFLASKDVEFDNVLEFPQMSA